MISVGIVDDHAIVRRGIRDFLSEQTDLRVIGEAASGKEALDLVRQFQPDVVLLDLSMPEQGGIEVLGSLLARAPEMAVLILSGYPEEHYALNLIKKGAMGYLSKDCDPTEIVRAIRKVAIGQRYISPVVAELLAQQLGKPTEALPHTQLSEREFQVFLRLAKGESNSDIANGLSLSAKTVSTYRMRTMEKLGFTTNSELTYYALKNGLIS